MDLTNVLSLIVGKLDASMLLLVLICYGVWKLADRFLKIVSEHGSSVVQELKGIRSELGGVTERVDGHEQRIVGLEKR